MKPVYPEMMAKRFSYRYEKV